MNYEIQSDELLIALDDELVDQVKAGDSLEIKEHPGICYSVTESDMDCLSDRTIGYTVYLELCRSEKTNWQYKPTGFRVSQ